jgi:hypothetical protein
MPNEEPLSLHYTYKLAVGSDYTFVFETKNDVVYQVDFNPDPDLLGAGVPFSGDVFELIIKVRASPVMKSLSLDRLIAPTIAAIVTEFYQICHQAVVLYICDSSDGRQAARWRKFNDWFAYFNQAEFVKHDLCLVDENDGVTYYNAVIIRNENPNQQAIADTFDGIISGYNDPK